ncbi:MAG: DUF1326 domain-containing protein [Verrucomicrobiota bacterium]
MSTNSKVKWFYEADYIQGCNCDYGCPCEFSAPPTKGFCAGIGAWKISSGKFGDVSLDGLALAFSAHWPKAMHEGNGTVCLFFDERANPQQRDALLQIAAGKQGGLPFEIIVTTFSEILEPQYVPFQFHIDEKNSSVKIGNAASIATESIKNPVTGEPENVRVEHGTGFIFKSAEVVSTKECMSQVSGAKMLNFSYPSKAGFVTKVKYGN